MGLAAGAGCWAIAEMMVVDAAAGSLCAEMGRSRVKRTSKKSCAAVAAGVDEVADAGDVGTAHWSRTPDAAGCNRVENATCSTDPSLATSDPLWLSPKLRFLEPGVHCPPKCHRRGIGDEAHRRLRRPILAAMLMLGRCSQSRRGKTGKRVIPTGREETPF